MKRLIIAALLASAAPAFAQDTTLASGSNAEANSGSQSGAQSISDQSQGQAQQANNAGIGNSTSESTSGSASYSGSQSGAESNGNQQGQSSSNTNSLGASQGNQQGVTVHQAWNYAPQRKVTEVRTNAAVPLAASSSFSSDYCGGTASGGASIAPIGVSIGGAGPTFDKSCQSLRRAEKFGMIAANYHNLGQEDMALKAMSMMIWSVCTADSRGPKAGFETMEACMASGLWGGPPVAPVPKDVTPLEASKPNVQPLPDQYKTPRGDLEFIAPTHPAEPVVAAATR